MNSHTFQFEISLESDNVVAIHRLDFILVRVPSGLCCPVTLTIPSRFVDALTRWWLHWQTIRSVNDLLYGTCVRSMNCRNASCNQSRILTFGCILPTPYKIAAWIWTAHANLSSSKYASYNEIVLCAYRSFHAVVPRYFPEFAIPLWHNQNTWDPKTYYRRNLQDPNDVVRVLSHIANKWALKSWTL